MSVADLRHNYQKFTLLEESVAETPFKQFTSWFNEALKAAVPEANAMTLATATLAGRPSARIVLLKGFDADGFVFFTNYTSRKAQDLSENPFASLLFFWPSLERQIRLEGSIQRVSATESDDYFKSRPLGSRIGAWVSPQSQPITKGELEARTVALTESLGPEPPRPDFWGGYRLSPDRFEFWQGRPSRLHDRLVFEKNDDGQWLQSRLAP